MNPPLQLLAALALGFTMIIASPGGAQPTASIPPSGIATQASPLSRAEPQAGDLHIITYHEVAADDAARRLLRDRQAVTQSTLVRHFSWLRDNGYTVVSMSQLISARSGGATLPPRAVLLSFDDAYKSFHSHVLPLLELFDYSATLAVVGLWIETSDNESIPFGDEKLSRARFMTWRELRDVAASGRVEIASHSFDLHRGHISNPQRNIEPIATTLRFDVGSNSYESVASLTARVGDDLRRNSELLLQRLGVRPRVVVWPYGAYTPGTQRIAAGLGMSVGLTLDNGINHHHTPLAALNRVLVQADTDVTDLERALRPQRERTERVLEVDLDAVFDANNAVQEKNVSALLDRLQRLAPSTIYLKSISAVRDAEGRPHAYFPTTVLPLRGDLFNRVAWQVRARLGISVYAWLPTAELPSNLTAVAAAGSSAALQILFADMARSVPTAGVYFSEPEEAADARVAALIHAVNNERPRLRIARRLAIPLAADLDAAADRARWQRRTDGIDWIIMAPPTRLDPVLSRVAIIGDERGRWGLAPTTVAARHVMERLWLQWAARGVPLDRIVWRATGDSATDASTLAALHAVGARHFSYGAHAQRDSASSIDIRHLLSTEGTPLVR